MKYKIYSPKVEVYVLTGGKNPVFYDLTDDVISGGVSRNINAPSTFYFSIQNKGNKYNGKLQPMDRITIYATKDQRYQLLTGYIQEVTSYTLFGDDFYISGYDTLYRLQNFYWNPNTTTSYRLLYTSGETETDTTGYCRVLSKMLALTGQNAVIGGFPKDCMAWVADMYSANVGDNSGEQNYEKFLKLLSLGGKLGSGSSLGSSNSSGTGTDAQQNVVNIALNGDSEGCDTQEGHCLAFVNDVYEKAGYPFARNAGAIDTWECWSDSGSTAQNNIPMAAACIGSGSGAAGAEYGHIGIYDGNGNVIDNEGGVTVSTLSNWLSWQTATCEGYTGWVGWCWPGDQDLSKMQNL